MRHTVRAIITKDKQMLLVTAHDLGFYWGPGGSVEEGETAEDALHREIMEELSVKVASHEPYRTYEFDDQKIDTFIVEIDRDFTLANEITDHAWYTSSSDVPIADRTRLNLIVDLVNDGYIE